MRDEEHAEIRDFLKAYDATCTSYKPRSEYLLWHLHDEELLWLARGFRS